MHVGLTEVGAIRRLSGDRKKFRGLATEFFGFDFRPKPTDERRKSIQEQVDVSGIWTKC
jgi:hypothetical protein